jgi:hypothetical protein
MRSFYRLKISVPKNLCNRVPIYNQLPHRGKIFADAYHYCFCAFNAFLFTIFSPLKLNIT